MEVRTRNVTPGTKMIIQRSIPWSRKPSSSRSSSRLQKCIVHKYNYNYYTSSSSSSSPSSSAEAPYHALSMIMVCCLLYVFASLVLWGGQFQGWERHGPVAWWSFLREKDKSLIFRNIIIFVTNLQIFLHNI